MVSGQSLKQNKKNHNKTRTKTSKQKCLYDVHMQEQNSCFSLILKNKGSKLLLQIKFVTSMFFFQLQLMPK